MKIQPLKMLKVEANITEIRQASATRYSLYFVFMNVLDVLLCIFLLIYHKILGIYLFILRDKDTKKLPLDDFD